jgi:hypothetical protein
MEPFLVVVLGGEDMVHKTWVGKLMHDVVVVEHVDEDKEGRGSPGSTGEEPVDDEHILLPSPPSHSSTWQTWDHVHLVMAEHCQFSASCLGRKDLVQAWAIMQMV